MKYLQKLGFLHNVVVCNKKSYQIQSNQIKPNQIKPEL